MKIQLFITSLYFVDKRWRCLKCARKGENDDPNFTKAKCEEKPKKHKNLDIYRKYSSFVLKTGIWKFARLNQ